MKTGWPPGLLQDDDRKLSRWFASRPGARYQVRKNIMEQQQPEALRLADFLLDWLGNNVEPADLEGACVSSAAELRRLDAVNAQLLKALEDLLADTQHADHFCGDAEWCPVVKARTAIAEAEKQKPVAWMTELPPKEPNETAFRFTAYKFVADEWENSTPLYAAPAWQAKPVAWWREDGSICIDESQAGAHDIPLYTDRRLIPRDYTAPPQRQPLTDEEIGLLKWHLSVNREYEPYTGQERLVVEGVKDFARAIEAKLKEKNT